MPTTTPPIRFGLFELDVEAGELRKDGAPVRLPPQPYKLLVLLASRPGQVVTRQDIRDTLWSDGTTVDFEQGVNFSVKQVREALGDDADEPRYIQTLPKRGYRFIAPVQTARRGLTGRLTDVNLHKALWANIAEIRIAEQRRRRLLVLLAALATVLLVLILVIY